MVRVGVPMFRYRIYIGIGKRLGLAKGSIGLGRGYRPYSLKLHHKSSLH